MGPFFPEVVPSVCKGQDEVQGPLGGGVCSIQTPMRTLSTLGPWDPFRPVAPLLAGWHFWGAGSSCCFLGLLKPEESWLATLCPICLNANSLPSFMFYLPGSAFLPSLSHSPPRANLSPLCFLPTIPKKPFQSLEGKSFCHCVFFTRWPNILIS